MTAMSPSILQPHPAYKPSGVEWLGGVPEHWRVLPGRACYSTKQISNVELREKTVLTLSYGQIKIKPEAKLHGLVPESFETYQIVEPGDIICRPTDLQNDWNSLRFGLSRLSGDRPSISARTGEPTMRTRRTPSITVYPRAYGGTVSGYPYPAKRCWSQFVAICFG